MSRALQLGMFGHHASIVGSLFTAELFLFLCCFSNQTFVASETATGQCTPVGAIIASHDIIPNLVKCLGQLNLALDHNFEPLYVTARPLVSSYVYIPSPYASWDFRYHFVFSTQGLAHG